MYNGEFYNSSEYNSTSEYKHFPAEMYIKPKEENKLGNEQASLGKEITTLQEKSNAPKGKDGSSTIIDKIFKSIKAVATTSTVAVASIVVTTTLITSAPKVELISLDCKDTYIEYEMEISELQDDSKYSIVVSTSNEEDREIEINENGTYKNKVEGLKPEWEYTLSFVSHDTAMGDITHFEVKFQTEKYVEQQPNPPPESYTGTYFIGEIEADWQRHEIIVPIEFENPNNQYYYIVKIYDTDGNELSAKKHTDGQNIAFPIIDSINKYKLTFELYGVGEIEEKQLESREIGILDYTPPGVDVLDSTIVGMNEIQIAFSVSNLNKDSNIQLAITHSNGTVEDTITLTSEDILKGYVTLYMDKGNSLSVKPISNVKYIGSDSVRIIEGPLYEKTFEKNLEVEALIGLSSGKTTFYPKGISNGAEFLYIVDSSKPSEPISEYYYNDAFVIYYNATGEITYTMYLSNENGDKLSTEALVTIDTSVEKPTPEYNMIYTNPGDVGVTYNDDGTINMYFVTNFETTDEELYYQVRVGDKRYISREKILEITSLQDKTYSIEYDICKDINGKQYSIYNIYPSGTANDSFIENGYAIEYASDTTLNLQFYLGLMYFDLNSIKIIASTGEEISLSESDFIYDSENRVHKATITFKEIVEYATIYMDANPSYGDLKDVDNYKGNITKSYEITV